MLYRRLCGSQESNRRRHHTNFAIDKQYNTDSFNLTIALPSLSRALLSLFIYIYISCLFPQSQFAEPAGYFSSTSFEELVLNAKEPITFADSVTGKRRERDTHLVPTYSRIWKGTHELIEQPTTDVLFSSCLVVLWTCFFPRTVHVSLGKPLFVAPIGRSAEQFVSESKVHGW